MSQPVTLTHEGALISSPASSPSSLLERLITSFTGTYQASRSSRPTIVAATDLAPFVVGLETIVKVRMFALRVNSGSIKVKVTSAAGTDQAVSTASFYIWHSPYAGDEITAIKLVGTGDVEYLVAGDVS